jgi:hypothetical protein
MIRLTAAGEVHIPEVPHNFVAWGGIKELLRVRGGAATREEVLDILRYCWHPDEKHQPNRHYLKYAIDSGWLAETE